MLTETDWLPLTEPEILLLAETERLALIDADWLLRKEVDKLWLAETERLALVEADALADVLALTEALVDCL